MSDGLTGSELEKLFKEWNKLKIQLKKFETEEERIKKLIHKQMDIENTNKLETKNYTCTRKNMIRETLSKAAVPRDVWEQYKRAVKVKQLILRREDDDE
jgi:isopropylmalate/homocitrate/citramalate synthase